MGIVCFLQNSDKANKTDLATKADASTVTPQEWSSMDLSSSWAAGSYIYYRRQAGDKQVKFYGGPLNVSSSYGAAFTLPESMRPTRSLYGECTTTNGAKLLYHIAQDGVFKIKSTDGSAISNATVIAALSF